MTKNKQILLIIICWAAYTFAQLGRYSYSSNITLIIEKFSLDHTNASIPTTLFFFAYGAGNILIGSFCHKFNRRILIIGALIISAIINIIIFLGANFITIKYLWFLNGFTQANLWPVMLLVLKENLSAENLPVAGIIMATASTGGKFVAIGTCAIFAIDVNLFMYCFLAAAILLFLGAFLFFIVSFDIKNNKIEVDNFEQQTSCKIKVNKKDVILLLLFGEFALTCYAISGGLQSWIPSILKENYNLSDALSIFMSVLLPLFTLSVTVITPFLCKKFNNYVLISCLAFVCGAILILFVLLFLSLHWFPVIILFTLESITMGVISNLLTVQVPLNFKGKFNAGFLAGYLNGACYIGMAIASYVLGALADISGWTGALLMLIFVALFSAILSIIYLSVSHKKLNQ